MAITYRWADSDQTVVFSSDGRFIPADENNTDYAALLRSGEVIEAYSEPRPTEDEIRAEVHRRIRVVLGAIDTAHAALIIADNERELRKIIEDGFDNSPRAQEIRALDADIEKIFTRYNELLEPYPFDYTDDKYWN